MVCLTFYDQAFIPSLTWASQRPNCSLAAGVEPSLEKRGHYLLATGRQQPLFLGIDGGYSSLTLPPFTRFHSPNLRTHGFWVGMAGKRRRRQNGVAWLNPHQPYLIGWIGFLRITGGLHAALACFSQPPFPRHCAGCGSQVAVWYVYVCGLCWFPVVPSYNLHYYCFLPKTPPFNPPVLVWLCFIARTLTPTPSSYPLYIQFPNPISRCSSHLITGPQHLTI